MSECAVAGVGVYTPGFASTAAFMQGAPDPALPAPRRVTDTSGKSDSTGQPKNASAPASASVD